MRRPPQDRLDAVERGRERMMSAGADEAEWRAFVRRWGGADSVDELDRDGCERLIDRLIACGWRDLARPCIISEDYRLLLTKWAHRVGLSPEECGALLTACGMQDGKPIDGDVFHRLVLYFEHRGIDMACLTRKVMTTRQIALLQVARRQLAISDDGFFRILRDTGGVVTSVRDLDKIGFRRVLVHLEALGFVPQAKAPSYGRRAGMATPEQVHLVRRLWRDYTGAEDEAALNRWLEGSFKVSSLRFATAAIASKAIDGLRAMIDRKSDQVA